jgi:hypothetical protein
MNAAVAIDAHTTNDRWHSISNVPTNYRWHLSSQLATKTHVIIVH